MSIKSDLNDGLTPLFRALREGHSALELAQVRADQIDHAIAQLWQAANPGALTLLAVGGYGRREVYPSSDIDLLVLVDDNSATEGLSAFIQSLWDLGLEVGHAVRTWEECAEEAIKDISTATAMLEARVLTGDPDAAKRLISVVEAAWHERDFFEAKRAEQAKRHNRRGDTDHNLEPDIKTSPGGLRDLHTLLWVARRLKGQATLEGLAQSDFLSNREYSLLREAQEFLSAARFALHEVAPRKQNRLLFNFQDAVAQALGFEGEHSKQRVERFMQRYYLMVLRVNEFNEVLLQQMAESLYSADQVDIIPLNQRFQIRNSMLEVTHDGVFEQSPQAIMEVFALLADNPAIIGLTASTTRLIYRSRHLIDDNFRTDVRVISHFLEILQRPQRLTDILRRMRLYGVLSNYIPSFGDIMGLMQHDLFHIFTVDAHTLELVSYLAAFWTGEHADKYPVATAATQRVPKIELLMLAGLFHDLGKGRGGDHSEIGAPEAESFCKRHWLSNYDAKLVAWLVRHHLVMSTTAQRKDISDPEVIREFAETVGSLERLDYLMALTVADISATNPELWNAWRASLLRQLYHATRTALQHGLDDGVPILADMIEDAKDAVSSQLKVGRDQLDPMWAFWGNSYFAQHRVEEIQWHTQALLDDHSLPQILIRNTASGTQVFVHTQDKSMLFSALCRVFESLHLNVMDARLNTSLDGRALDSFVVMQDHKPITDESTLEQLRTRLLDACARPRDIPMNRPGMTPRIMRHFNQPIQAKFMPDTTRNRTVLELIAPDRPGLLAGVASVLDRYEINLMLAKIATLGERVEDYFYLVDATGKAIEDQDTLAQLKRDLETELDHSE